MAFQCPQPINPTAAQPDIASQPIMQYAAAMAACHMCVQVIELLWNLLELAPAATYDALASLQRPKTPAATTAAAASNSPDAQEQQQEQQQQCLEHVQPWDTSTLASTAPDPDIWTRQSCCPSAGCSRPETGLADAEQAPQAASALGGAAHGIAAPQTGDVRLQTAIRPVSAATTPSLQDVQQQAWQEQLASNLVEVLGQLLKQQMADTSSKQVCGIVRMSAWPSSLSDSQQITIGNHHDTLC